MIINHISVDTGDKLNEYHVIIYLVNDTEWETFLAIILTIIDITYKVFLSNCVIFLCTITGNG